MTPIKARYILLYALAAGLGGLIYFGLVFWIVDLFKARTSVDDYAYGLGQKVGSMGIAAACIVTLTLGATAGLAPRVVRDPVSRGVALFLAALAIYVLVAAAFMPALLAVGAYGYAGFISVLVFGAVCSKLR